MYFIDGSIPISRFLLNHTIDKKQIPCIKIPPVVDFDEIDSINRIDDGKFFLYVGSAAFVDAIETVISAFEHTDSNEFKLFLILSGSGLNRFKKKVVNSPKKQLIRILSGLPYQELIGLMKGAAALLIPLNDRIQDKARFPNKIAEYLASKRPIITNNVGDIEEYFSHEKNAILSEDSSAVSLAKSLQFVIGNPDKSDEIGKNGYLTGRENFSTQSISGPLKEFLNQFI
jgi:glycosyltransferase involved in cell wall biosynthesis